VDHRNGNAYTLGILLQEIKGRQINTFASGYSGTCFGNFPQHGLGVDDRYDSHGDINSCHAEPEAVEVDFK
jgi:hypothetical protein